MKTVKRVGELQTAFVHGESAKCHGRDRIVVSDGDNYYVDYKDTKWQTGGRVVIVKRFHIDGVSVYVRNSYFDQASYNVETEHSRGICSILLSNSFPAIANLKVSDKENTIVDVLNNTMEECLDKCAKVTLQKYRNYVLYANANVTYILNKFPQLLQEVDPLTWRGFDALCSKAGAIYKKRMEQK